MLQFLNNLKVVVFRLYSGFDNGSGNWDEHSNYVNANSLHVVPPVSSSDFIPLLLHLLFSGSFTA